MCCSSVAVLGHADSTTGAVDVNNWHHRDGDVDAQGRVGGRSLTRLWKTISPKPKPSKSIFHIDARTKETIQVKFVPGV